MYKNNISIRTLGIFVMLFIFVPMVFSQNNRVMCEVAENDKSISVVFGEDIKYLGSDYEKQIGLYDDRNKLKFDTAIEVVSYLCSHWGWRQCGLCIRITEKPRYTRWNIKSTTSSPICGSKLNFSRNTRNPSNNQTDGE